RGQLGPARHSGNSIVVLTFNSSPTIEACLESVLGTMGPGDELIVVDNASADATLEIVEGFRAADPRVAIIANGANLGFSAGCNVGLRASGGARVLLLNPDTVVYGGWLETLAEGLADPSVGMVGPLSDNVAGDQFVAAHLNLKGRSGLSPQGLAQECREELAGRSVSTKLLIGLCVAMRRETLDKVGLLDEDLFLGNDDLEISWRLRTHGFTLLVMLDAFVHHECGVSFASLPKGTTSRMTRESTERLREKVRAAYGWSPTSTELWGADIR
ncbi:MAG: glycosyltransferase family 2 protein, partial [Alphaproteobacteria bacterium]